MCALLAAFLWEMVGIGGPPLERFGVDGVPPGSVCWGRAASNGLSVWLRHLWGTHEIKYNFIEKI